MLRFTRRSEYAVLALAYLASHGPGYVRVREIVAQLCLPRRLAAEVLKDLAHAGMVEAVRGPNGGYRLRVDPKDVSLAEIVGALEGHEPELIACTNGKTCDIEPHCLVQDGMRRVHSRIVDVLQDTTLASFLAHSTPASPPIEV